MSARTTTIVDHKLRPGEHPTIPRLHTLDTMASLQSTSTPSKLQSGLRYPSNGKTIYHRPLNRTKTAELSQASFAYLFSEMVSYAQRRVKGIQDLEQRYFPPSMHLCLLSVARLMRPILAGLISRAIPSASSYLTCYCTASHPAARPGP